MSILQSYLYGMVYWTIEIYIYMAIVYFIASWFIRDRYVGWFVFLGELIEPVLYQIRRLTGNRLVFSGVDLSPLLLFAALHLVKYIFGRLLLS